MTKKERVKRTLNHKESDIIPYELSFTGQAYEKMAAYLGDRDFHLGLNSHISGYQYWGWPTEMAGGGELFRDEFGVIWDRSGADKDIGAVTTPLIPDLEEHDYVLPPIDGARLRREIIDMLAGAEDRFSFVGIGFSMFERAWSLGGMENILMAMLTSPAELDTLLDAICERNLKTLDIILEFDVDGVYFGDDWGQQKGLIMGPEHWRRFIKPQMQRMYAKVKQAGKPVAQHSCGDIFEIFPDLIEIGLDCYQTFQPEIYDIERVKREYGADLTFWGGISTQQLLPVATPAVVKNETARIMRIMGKGGGYIAAPTHSLPGDIPPENIAAMLEVFQGQ